jgi:hypothetical protein
MTTILETEYVEQTRPYSLNELGYMREQLYKRIKLGKVRSIHEKCGHFYLVKKNGRREKEILEKNDNDTGHCSVCWKFNKTPKHLRTKAKELICAYQEFFFKDPEYLTYNNVDLETTYYKWLYEFV